MSELSTPYFYYVEDEYINFLKKKEILPECLMYIIGILKNLFLALCWK